jgi:hypothetical protein
LKQKQLKNIFGHTKAEVKDVTKQGTS